MADAGGRDEAPDWNGILPEGMPGAEPPRSPRPAEAVVWSVADERGRTVAELAVGPGGPVFRLRQPESGLALVELGAPDGWPDGALRLNTREGLPAVALEAARGGGSLSIYAPAEEPEACLVELCGAEGAGTLGLAAEGSAAHLRLGFGGGG